jgi:hypothetical protein
MKSLLEKMRGIRKILGAVCVLSLILTGCEYPDGSVGLWNFIWLAVCFVSAMVLCKLDKEKI